MRRPSTHKTRRPFNEPVAEPKRRIRFIDLPASNRRNYNLPLSVVAPEVATEIEQAGRIVFHTIGDTGGVHGTEAQGAISDAMEAQITQAAAGQQPQFFYHLGDVVYFNGQSTLYREQFYSPYKYYPAVIFAIPGNHDGDTQVHRGDPIDTEPSLYGFTENFCDSQPRHLFPYRETMTQPYVFWTLEAPLVTIIGLYSNVEGFLDGPGTNEQQRWLIDQLRSAPANKCLIVAVHHPPYSLDEDHGGYAEIGAALDSAMVAAGRKPDAVFSGHVHDYQRFTRTINGDEIPYVVAGAGGYAHNARAMHKMLRDAGGKLPDPLPFPTSKADVTLAAFDDTEPGFLRVTVEGNELRGEYSLVPFDGSAVTAVDRFRLDWTTHRLI